MNLKTERMAGAGSAFLSGFYINYLHGVELICKKYVGKDTRVLELGSFNGISTELFSKHSNFVTAVDVTLRDELREVVERCGVGFHQADSIAFLESLERGKYDLIYIDTTHDWRTKREIEEARVKVSDGGYVCGHDYLSEGVHKAILEVFPFPEIEIYLDSSWLIKV